MLRFIIKKIDFSKQAFVQINMLRIESAISWRINCPPFRHFITGYHRVINKPNPRLLLVPRLADTFAVSNQRRLLISSPPNLTSCESHIYLLTRIFFPAKRV